MIGRLLYIIVGLAACGFLAQPLMAQHVSTDAVSPPADSEPIISDEEFASEMPSLDAPPLESIAEWTAAENAQDAARGSPDPDDSFADAPMPDPQLDEPLPPITSFDVDPPAAIAEASEATGDTSVRFALAIQGLAADGNDGEALARVQRRFRAVSALDDLNQRADSRADLAAATRGDRRLLHNVLVSEGFFDADVAVRFNSDAAAGEAISIILSAQPGRRYSLGEIAFVAAPTAPGDLIRRSFPLAPGDPIVADHVIGAEATLSLKLPENGYPFAAVGERDIELDPASGIGNYLLPVNIGPRSYFGEILAEGNLAFDAEHVAVLRRFRTGDLYDARKVDDLRAAMIATGLLSSVTVEPVPSTRNAPDGTPYADLRVRQEAGPPRTLAASAGYSTGQGIRLEGSWTHRNLFPPEGGLTAALVVGTQEQSVSGTFRRNNAGSRDRIVELTLAAERNDFDAFDAYTGRLTGTISRVSTPIWQKRITYAYGFELLATSETQFDVRRSVRDRQLYYVAALPLQAGFDTSDNLLDARRGYRLTLRLSPETALGEGSRLYLRGLMEGSYYRSLGENIVLAARARLGAISGTTRASLPPSRRYYGGGGGSVRGFGYQQLGPRDIEGNPLGGRSLNEAAAEVRYRFGNFGVTGFVDAGQVYTSSLPRFNDWRFGVGIGGRFHTNFGPMRLDVATPINRRPGESHITVYVSLGQAF